MKTKIVVVALLGCIFRAGPLFGRDGLNLPSVPFVTRLSVRIEHPLSFTWPFRYELGKMYSSPLDAIMGLQTTGKRRPEEVETRVDVFS